MTQCDPTNVVVLTVMVCAAAFFLYGWFVIEPQMKQKDASIDHMRACLHVAFETARKYEPDFSLADVKP